MLTNNTFVKVNKLITEDKLTISELYELISYMNRRYMDLLVKDNIKKYIDNNSLIIDKVETDSELTSNLRHQISPNLKDNEK